MKPDSRCAAAAPEETVGSVLTWGVAMRYLSGELKARRQLLEALG
jgi:hypothetical protein